jgi:predicted MPP superfamily phosphohydrolase
MAEPERVRSLMTRRRFVRLAFGAYAAGAGAGLYTWLWEPHWVEFIRRELPIANLPVSLIGRTLVQLSDLHVGPQVSEAFLQRTFRAVQELKAEIVVYTGDFISYSDDAFTRAARVFPHLPRGSMATLGVLGNHDYGDHWSEGAVAQKVAELAATTGVRVLRNEVALVAGVLQVGGMDDLWSGQLDVAAVLSQLEPDCASLVLCHNPDAADLPVWGNHRGWILCGHTHGGQCKPPFLPPPLLPVKNRKYTAGVIDLSWHRHMYINRGLGHLLRVRFNVRPEVTVFRLARAKDQPEISGWNASQSGEHLAHSLQETVHLRPSLVRMLCPLEQSRFTRSKYCTPARGHETHAPLPPSGLRHRVRARRCGAKQRHFFTRREGSRCKCSAALSRGDQADAEDWRGRAQAASPWLRTPQ